MEHVLNETKAREIAKSNGINYKNHSKYEDDMDSTLECYKSALEAMDWKDEQEIEFLQSLMFQASTQQALGIIINNRIKLLKGEQIMKTMTNDEIAEMIAERNGNQHFCKNCDDCCQPYDSTDDCFKSALQAMQWKDVEHANEKQQWIDKAAEWFGNYLFDIGYPDDWLRDSPNTKNGKTRFIQAMEGE